MKKEIIEEIIEYGLNKLEELTDDTETTVYSLIAEKLKEIDVKLDIHDILQINNEIKQRAEKNGIILDYSLYKDQYVGLPYSIPFVKIGKK